MKCQSLEKHTSRIEKVTPILLVDTQLRGARSYTQQWWMAITSLSVLQADRVFILASKHRPNTKGKARNLTDEGEIFRRASEKAPHLKTAHMSEVVNRQINSSLRLLSNRVCVIVQAGGCNLSLYEHTPLRRWWKNVAGWGKGICSRLQRSSILSFSSPVECCFWVIKV